MKNQGPMLFGGIELWRKMSINTRLAFVKWLAADSSIALYTQADLDAAIAADREQRAAQIEQQSPFPAILRRLRLPKPTRMPTEDEKRIMDLVGRKFDGGGQ